MKDDTEQGGALRGEYRDRSRAEPGEIASGGHQGRRWAGRAYLRPAEPGLVGLLVQYRLGSSSKRYPFIAHHMTGRVHLEGIVALTAEVALDSGSGCHRFRLDRMVFWNSLLQRPMNDLLSFGRLLYRRYAVMGKYPVAFGDWARLSRESLESLPGVGRVSNTSFRRTHYLIRIMKTIEGRIAALHVHGQNYKPLFTHHCLDPDQPLFETPWWAEQCR